MLHISVAQGLLYLPVTAFLIHGKDGPLVGIREFFHNIWNDEPQQGTVQDVLEETVQDGLLDASQEAVTDEFRESIKETAGGMLQHHFIISKYSCLRTELSVCQKRWVPPPCRFYHSWSKVWNFALVISDITLPDGTGLDFGKKVRESGNTYLIYLYKFPDILLFSCNASRPYIS